MHKLTSLQWSLKISGRGLALLLTVINLLQNWKCKVPMSSLVVLCKIEPYHYPLQMSPGLDCFVSAVLWEQHFSFFSFSSFSMSSVKYSLVISVWQALQFNSSTVTPVSIVSSMVAFDSSNKAMAPSLLRRFSTLSCARLYFSWLDSFTLLQS